MTKLMALLFTLTTLVATDCYAHPRYYAGPAYGPRARVYVAPTSGYVTPYSYGYGYERPGVYVAPQPVYVAPGPVFSGPRPAYREPMYASRIAFRPVPYRMAPGARSWRR